MNINCWFSAIGVSNICDSSFVWSLWRNKILLTIDWWSINCHNSDHHGSATLQPENFRSGTARIRWQCCWKFISRLTGEVALLCIFSIQFVLLVWYQWPFLVLCMHCKRLAAEDEEFAGEARQAFAKLEEGHQQSLQDWKICRYFLNLNW